MAKIRIIIPCVLVDPDYGYKGDERIVSHHLAADLVGKGQAEYCEKENDMSVTLREIDWRMLRGQVSCPAEEGYLRPIIQCRECKHWRWFKRPDKTFRVRGAVSETGVLATHVHCAYPEACSKCGRDCNCGRK